MKRWYSECWPCKCCVFILNTFTVDQTEGVLLLGLLGLLGMWIIAHTYCSGRDEIDARQLIQIDFLEWIWMNLAWITKVFFPKVRINNIPVLVQIMAWLGANQATRHYLNQWWVVCWRIYASLGLNELNKTLLLGIWIMQTFGNCFYYFHCGSDRRHVGWVFWYVDSIKHCYYLMLLGKRIRKVVCFCNVWIG